MQVVFEHESSEVDLDVTVRHPAARVGDLAGALDAFVDGERLRAGNGRSRRRNGLAATNGATATNGSVSRRRGTKLVIGGRLVEPSLPLAEAGLHQGAVIRFPNPSDGADQGWWTSTGEGSDVVLAVTGGLVAGPSWPLVAGETIIGRDPYSDVVIDDRTVSHRHCSIRLDPDGQLTVQELGSRNGTYVDGEVLVGPRPLGLGSKLELGAVTLSLLPGTVADRLPEAQLRRVNAAGCVSVNRPPRPAPEPDPEPLAAPSAPAAAPLRTPLSIAAIIAPLAFAVVMVLAMGRMIFALFALLSPVMAIGTWIESRRRAKKSTRTGSRRFASELAEFRGAVVHRVQTEAGRRRKTMPHPAELMRWACAPSTRLWERRPRHGDFLQLHGGVGALPWRPPVTSDRGRPPPEVEEELNAAGVLTQVPVPVDLSGGGVVGLVGDRDATLAVARCLLLQATTLSGPADLQVGVVTDADRVAAWDWAKWLPHTAGSSDGEEGRRLACDVETGDALIRELLVAGAKMDQRAGPGPVSLLVLDVAALTERRNAPARDALAGHAETISGIVIADAVHRLPDVCTTVVELFSPHGDARLSRPQHGEVVEGFLAAGVTATIGRRWARELARFEDPEVVVAGSGLPDGVSLSSLLEDDPFDPESVADGWRRRAVAARPVAPIGISEEGVFAMDLVADGPHGLVVGTTGSGKSELLRTLVASLAVTLDPEHINFVMFDYKGGRAFDQCASLPHTVGLVTDLDEQLGERALRVLEGELRRRERVLRAAGAADLDDYLHTADGRRPGTGPLPRLLVIVDEFATMAAELPRFIDALVDIAQRGRGLGIHLLLATQRPSGAVSANIKANTNFRIALRVQSEGDSVEAIGTSAATTVPQRRPGRGFARLGRSDLVVFQTARVDEPTGGHARPVAVAPFGFDSSSRVPDTVDERTPKSALDLGTLIETVNAAAARSGVSRPVQLWSEETAANMGTETVELPGLLSIEDVAAMEPEQTWRPRSDRDRLRVPIGVTPDGQPLHLDLKESALAGMGPHGLVVGATGSGKSELLRTLVSALAMTHSPEELSCVLVDFKGGATFAGMADLPHVAGIITNLEDDLALVDRMRDSLFGEQRRRQELLRTAGNLASVHEYRERRLGGADLEALPSLLVIVDEFAELLTAKPDFIDLFVSIGRLGRSLGIHLLLSSQRLEEGRLRGLESHIRYRIGLRTFSAQESRTVLGVPDAYELPSEPGVGYLKVDTTTFTRFKAALVSTPYAAPGNPVGDQVATGTHRRSTLDVAVERLSQAAPQVHQVWLPPLEPVVSLTELLPGLAADPERGLVAVGWPGVGSLSVPVGVLDRPQEQRRDVLAVDTAGANGNVVVVGAPQTGKSTLLRTFLSAFALTHTPVEVQFYCIDYGGGGLAALAGLPHVGAVASRLEPDKVRRVVAEVDGVLARREELFRERGIDSVASLRALRGAGELPEEELGDVFLLIDNWPGLRQAFEDLEPSVLDIAARGLGYGVHVVVTASRWVDIRSNLRDSLGTRLELRLAEPAESSIDRKVADNVAVGVPGRGLTASKLHFQAAVPRLDSNVEATNLQSALEDLVSRVATAWPGPAAQSVRLLPSLIEAEELPAPSDQEAGVPVGIVETDLTPLYLDLAAGDPHFLVFGDAESGKTAFLRTFLTKLCARRSPGEVRVAIFDYRRTLLEVVGPDHLGFYAGAAPAAQEGVQALREVLTKRLPGADVSAAQLRQRSWWEGPELYVVVDDYDLVATTTGNPLAPLVDFLAQGRDLGFHLILARRVAGAQRGLFEPVLQRVKELGSPGLLLSGDRGEGALLGSSRATALPPGRGVLVRRKEQPVLVQVAWTPEELGADAPAART